MIPQNVKLGKLAPKPSAKTLKLRTYLHSDAPVIPATQAWDHCFRAWTMLKNDVIGCCTVAAIAHMVQLWTAYHGTMVKPTADQVIEVYSAITGYDPSQTDASGFNPTDNGAAISDVLEYWRKVGIAGHKIDGWAQIDHTNIQETKTAIYLFGGINPGLQVPQSAMDQALSGREWKVVKHDGGILGGHSVPVFDYSPTDGVCATWGMKQMFTWDFWLRYVDESYAIISLDWLDKQGVAPNHINLEALRADLKSLS